MLARRIVRALQRHKTASTSELAHTFNSWFTPSLGLLSSAARGQKVLFPLPGADYTFCRLRHGDDGSAVASPINLNELRQEFTTMATYTLQGHSTSAGQIGIPGKVWREIKRPFRTKKRSSSAAARESIMPQSCAPPAPALPDLAGRAPTLADFHPGRATVEPAGIPLVQRLVRESRKYPGPIVEIGTLLGITTTSMALVKAPEQKIITVDLYCWNPWGFTPEIHEALTAQMLNYLVQTGHVERIRMDKDDFFRTYQGPEPAMVFLDAMHDYEATKKDIQWAMRAGARIIAGHDYCDEFPGVKQIVDECGGPRDLRGSVWVL